MGINLNIENWQGKSKSNDKANFAQNEIDELKAGGDKHHIIK